MNEKNLFNPLFFVQLVFKIYTEATNEVHNATVFRLIEETLQQSFFYFCSCLEEKKA